MADGHNQLSLLPTVKRAPAPDEVTCQTGLLVFSIEGTTNYRMPISERVSMRTIARTVGISVTTVSYALRNDPCVNAATKAKVLEAARRLGYTPDPALAILNAYRRDRAGPNYAGNIAFLCCYPRLEPKNDQHFIVKYFLGAKDRGSSLGYQVDWFPVLETGMTPKRLSQILLARNIRGAIVSPFLEHGSSLDLEWAHFSAVRIAYSMKSPALHRISNDHFKALSLCLRELFQLGYERVGLIDTEPTRTELHLLGSYLAYQSFWNKPSIPVLHEPDFTDQRLQEWMEGHRLDAVIGSAYTQKERIRQLGQDLGFVLPYTCNDPSVACASENWFEVGKAAVSMLVDLIHRNDRGIPDLPYTYLIDPVWHQGDLKPRGNRHGS